MDAEGRLFQRVNAVDAMVVGGVALLLPLAYAAYLLFRIPNPQITGVELATLTHVEERSAADLQLPAKR